MIVSETRVIYFTCSQHEFLKFHIKFNEYSFSLAFRSLEIKVMDGWYLAQFCFCLVFLVNLYFLTTYNNNLLLNRNKHIINNTEDFVHLKTTHTEKHFHLNSIVGYNHLAVSAAASLFFLAINYAQAWPSLFKVANISWLKLLRHSNSH